MLKVKGFLDIFPNDNEIGILTTQMKVKDLLDIYSIEADVNRDINDQRVSNLSKYLNAFDSESGIYLPAIILSYEGEEPNDEPHNTYVFPENGRFVVLDGQHRLKGLERFKNSESDMNRLTQVLDSTVTTQIYFGLDRDKKRGLFIDINALSRKVSKNLSVSFDGRDAVNKLIQDLLSVERGNSLEQMGIDSERARIVRPGNKVWMSSIRLNRFISYLLLGTGSTSNSTNKLIFENYDRVFEFLKQYFYLLKIALPAKPGDVHDNLLGHEALQNALAIVSHEKIVRLTKETIEWREGWEEFVEIFEYIDWNINSNLFSSLTMRKGGKNGYTGFEDSKSGDVIPLLKREINMLTDKDV